MSNHIRDATKMVSDTPRTDAAEKHAYQFKDEWTPICESKLVRQLERELNAANQRILWLEGELESTKADRDSWSNQSDEFAKTAADLILRIQRLEEAGDALKAAGYFGGFGDAVNKWNKAKESKP
jgi:chromosome segregation ATPase